MAVTSYKKNGYVASKRKALAVAGAIGGVLPFLMHAGSAYGITLTWDPGLTPLTPSGGTGTWDLNTTANWSNATTDAVWADTNGSNTVAIFGGTAGTVTVNSNLGAEALAFLTTGYTITGTGTISLAGASNNTGFTVASGVTAEIDNPVTWRGNSPTIGITPGSTLTFGGTFTGAATSKPTFFGGTLNLNGDLSNFAGSLEMNTSNAVQNTASQPSILASPSGIITYGATTGTFGTSAAIITIAEGATLQANKPLNLIGNLQLKDGVGVTNSILAGTANVTIANLYDNNTNGELVNNLTGGALLTLGSSTANSVNLGGTSATFRMFSIGGSGNTVINGVMQDFGTINGAAGSNAGKDHFNWNDSGTLTINAAGAYGGSTFLSQGTTVLGVTNAFPVTTPVTMGSLAGGNATLDLNGNSQTVASINATTGNALSLTPSTFQANSAIVKFTATPATGMAIGQTVSNPSLPSGTTILGIVTLSTGETDITLSNFASAAAVGPVVFTAGAATPASQIIGNSSTISNSTLSLTGASTWAGTIQDHLGTGNQKMAVILIGATSSLNVTGVNTYTGGTSVTTGAVVTLSPGGSLFGNINVDAASTMNLSGGELDYNLLSTGLTSTVSDLGVLNVTGTNIIGISSTDSSLTPGTYTLISDPNTFADTATSFEFSNLSTTETLTVGGTPYTLTLQDPASSSVTLTVSPVPEPATFSLLGLASLGLLRRKRR